MTLCKQDALYIDKVAPHAEKPQHRYSNGLLGLLRILPHMGWSCHTRSMNLIEPIGMSRLSCRCLRLHVFSNPFVELSSKTLSLTEIYQASKLPKHPETKNMRSFKHPPTLSPASTRCGFTYPTKHFARTARARLEVWWAWNKLLASVPTARCMSDPPGWAEMNPSSA